MMIRLEECPLCSGKTLVGLTVKSPVQAVALKSFEMPELPQWNLCSGCCFLFQNPRPSRETIEKYYRDSGYRIGNETLISQGYIDFSPHQLARLHPWLLL